MFQQNQYRRRSRVIEFCHAWIKSKLGLRQFHLRGLAKVQMEMLWAGLTYTCNSGSACANCKLHLPSLNALLAGRPDEPQATAPANRLFHSPQAAFGL